MNYLHAFKIIAVCCFLSLSVLTNVSAVQRCDDPGVIEQAKAFAKDLPYATGILLNKAGNISSALFLDETTVLTCAHDFIGYTKMPHIVIASDELSLFSNNGGSMDWDKTLAEIKNRKLPWASVKFQKPLTKFTEKAPNAVEITDFTSTYFSNLLNQLENFTETLYSKKLNGVGVAGKDYSMDGHDISVLKLHNPITLMKKPFPLVHFCPENLEDYIAYGFGLSTDNLISDGTAHQIVVRTSDGLKCEAASTVIHPYNLKLSPDKSFYHSKFYSVCGVDEQFVCDDLPCAKNNKFIGSLAEGMSGGPLLLMDNKGDYHLVGMNTKTLRRDVKVMLDFTINTIENIVKTSEDHEFNRQLDLWGKDLQKEYTVKYPIYNIFQAFTPEVIEKINKMRG